MALTSFPTTNFNPIGVDSTSVYYTLIPMYDMLVGVNADSTMGPGIAESWDMASDGMSWTFHIRKGLKFHNGDPLTADDVQFSLLAFANRIPGAVSTSSKATDMDRVMGDVVVIDPNTVKVNLKVLDVNFAYRFSAVEGTSEGIVMPKAYVQKAGWDAVGRQPVGSGPWKYVAAGSGDYIKYEAVQGHWRHTPNFQFLNLMNVPEEPTRVAMLQTDAADIAEITLDSVGTVKKAGLWTASSAQSSQIVIRLYGVDYTDAEGGMSAPAVRDVRVRQALSLAIDRAELAQVFEGDASQVGNYPFNIFSSSIDVNFAALPKTQTDFVKAKQLLADAGFANGFSMTLFQVIPPGAPEAQKMAEVLAAYWARIGIKVTLVPRDYAALQSSVKAKPPTAMEYRGNGSLTKFTAAPESGVLYRSMFTAAGSNHLIRMVGIDEKITAASSEPDPQKRKQLMTEVITDCNNQFVIIPLVYSSALWALDSKIKSIQTYPAYPYLNLSYETAVK